MDKDQLMMKARSQFIGRKHGMIELIARIVKQVSKSGCNLHPVDADIFIRSSESSCPLPRAAKHFAMQIAHEEFV